MVSPLVSIVIPTKNSSRTLSICLTSISRQTYGNIEIIVVDGYSTDDTVEIARRFGAYIFRHRGERARAKNLGLIMAGGKYVLFLDSDMELTPRVIEECVALAESDQRIAGIVIPERSVGSGWLGRIRDFERSFYMDTSIESPRFFRRDIAVDVGGFDEDLVFYEEATLAHKIERAGYWVKARIGSPIIHHEEGLSLSRLLMKRYYYGKTLARYISRYPEQAYMQVSPIYRIKIFLGNRRFYLYPHLGVGVIAVKLLEYIATMIGSLSSEQIE